MSKRNTEPLSERDNSLAALFAEAEVKKTERDGIVLTIGPNDTETQEFVLWMTRFTYEQRMRIRAHTGVSLDEIGAMFASGGGGLEAFAAFIAASMYQTSKKFPGMDGVLAWVEQALTAEDSVLTVDTVSFDDAKEGDSPELSGQD